jgi:pSer/pThr/pTyr-binding forkhead associated (FHA) protein
VFLLEKRTGNVFSQQISVGRTTNMDVCLPLSGISKFHAHFSQRDDGEFMLTDNDSTNGTFVDGTALTAHAPHKLSDGCEVRFAKYAFRFMSTRRFAHLVDGLWEMSG